MGVDMSLTLEGCRFLRLVIELGVTDKVRDKAMSMDAHRRVDTRMKNVGCGRSFR